MQSVSSIRELQEILADYQLTGKSIGLVPTMGNLHEGHLALVKEAIRNCDVVVATIFVNPLQFGPKEDFKTYPRTLEKDKALLEHAGCQLLFTPSIEEMYGNPAHTNTIVRVSELSEDLCGANRPGHFDGVATVVSKLFNIVEPHSAFFGYKDYQQFLVIKQLVHDLSFNIVITGVETVREEDGLAMSSRNNFLSKEERVKAAALYRTLDQCRTLIINGECDYSKLASTASSELFAAGLLTDYFEIRDGSNLQPPLSSSSELVILGAVKLGNTRLIDNLRIKIANPAK